MRWLAFPFSPLGRIDRSRFWAVVGLAVATVVVPVVVMAVVMLATPDNHDGDMPSSAQFNELVISLGVLALTALTASYLVVAAGARRFNDRGKSSWWVFVAFIPVAGPVWCLVELGFLPGSLGRNPWGPAPRADPAEMSAVFGDAPVEIVAPASRISCVLAVLAAWTATVLAMLAILFLQLSPSLRSL